MSHSAIESLPLEILLRICELLNDIDPTSLHEFSETSHRVRDLASMVLFRKVVLPIRPLCSHESIEEDVQRLFDTLGPIYPLGHIRTLDVGLYCGFTLMEGRFATQSRLIIQQVLASLAPNIQDVSFWRRRLDPYPGRLTATNQPMGTDSLNLSSPLSQPKPKQSTQLRRLEINAQIWLSDQALTRQDLESWHTHVSFSHLHTLDLRPPLDEDALRWMIECDFACLKVLNLQICSKRHLERSQTIIALAKTFVTSLPPLSELTIKDRWSIHILEAVYRKHGASLRTLRLPETSGLVPNTAISVLERLRDQCPLLTDLEILITRDQGNLTEATVYKTFATFQAIRRLTIHLRTRWYALERDKGRMPPYHDRFDQHHSGSYGDLRRTLIDLATDENFAKTVFRLASPSDRIHGLEELELMTEGGPHTYGGRFPRNKIILKICRSWNVRSVNCIRSYSLYSMPGFGDVRISHTAAISSGRVIRSRTLGGTFTVSVLWTSLSTLSLLCSLEADLGT